MSLCASLGRARWLCRRAPLVLALLFGPLMFVVACASPEGARYRALAESLESRRTDVALPVARTRSARRASSDETLARGAALFAGADVLERARLVEAVLERNPNLEAAHAGIRAALARYPQVTALDDPMLGVGVAPLSFGARSVHAAGRIDLAQRLPFPGKRRLAGEAALSEAEAAIADLASLRLELATLASKLFDDALLAVRALEINAAHTALLDELHQTALARYAAGQDSKQSVLQAEMAKTRALVERSDLESAALLTTERINALLHRAPALPLPPLAPSHASTGSGHDLPPNAAAPPDSSEAVIAEALDARPELAAADARENAAHARVSLAARALYPDFTVIGAYDRLWQERALAPFVGVQMNLPIQLGRRRAALDESRADLERTRHRRLALEDEVRLAARRALLRLDQAKRTETILRDRLLPAASEQANAARSGYATGTASFGVLVDALRDLHEVELDHAQAIATLSQRSAELDRALGRLPETAKEAR